MYKLTKAQYNNLLPTCLKSKLWLRIDPIYGELYYLFGTKDDYNDAMARCKYLD